jgi:hypothetical protein
VIWKEIGRDFVFSFTSGAYDEVARVGLLDELNRLEIKLKTVKEVLKES